MLQERTEATKTEESRRSFLTKLGIGVAAWPAYPPGLIKFDRNPSSSSTTQEFPGPDSIFHPAKPAPRPPSPQLAADVLAIAGHSLKQASGKKGLSAYLRPNSRSMW